MADIRRIDLNLLVALDTLLDERNVTRAAARLSLSQPTVSGMLNRLREIFGDPLFIRTQRGILPTPRAQALAEPLKQWLADADALTRPAAFDPETAALTFTIQLNDYFQQSLLVPYVAALGCEAPGVRLAVKPLTDIGLPEELARGEMDLAVTVSDFAPPELPSLMLYSERYVGAVCAGHPLAGGRVSLADFCRFDHVIVSPTGGSFEGPTDDALAAVGRTRRVRLSVPSFLVLPDVLLTGHIIGVVPERLLRDQGGSIEKFRLPVRVPGFDVVAVWHPRSQEEPAHRWLRERLRDVASELPETRKQSRRGRRPDGKRGRP